MTTQNYFIIENNVVTNSVVWDGDFNTWTPPQGSIQLIEDTTPAMVWVLHDLEIPPDFQLTEVIGAGSIGFSWDGSVLITNEPKPIYVPPVPPIPVTNI